MPHQELVTYALAAYSIAKTVYHWLDTTGTLAALEAAAAEGNISKAEAFAIVKRPAFIEGLLKLLPQEKV